MLAGLLLQLARQLSKRQPAHPQPEPTPQFQLSAGTEKAAQETRLHNRHLKEVPMFGGINLGFCLCG